MPNISATQGSPSRTQHCSGVLGSSRLPWHVRPTQQSVMVQLVSRPSTHVASQVFDPVHTRPSQQFALAVHAPPWMLQQTPASVQTASAQQSPLPFGHGAPPSAHAPARQTPSRRQLAPEQQSACSAHPSWPAGRHGVGSCSPSSLGHLRRRDLPLRAVPTRSLCPEQQREQRLAAPGPHRLPSWTHWRAAAVSPVVPGTSRAIAPAASAPRPLRRLTTFPTHRES